MKSPLSYQARRELVEQMAPQYREVSRAQKMLLLDTFVAMTGYVRTYAMWLLNHPVESAPSVSHARPVHYGPEVQQALLFAWKAANQICAKRLIPFLPTLVEATAAAWASAPHGEVPKPTALDERIYGGPASALPTKTRFWWEMHHPSWNAAQTSDSHTHFRRVE